MTFLPQFLGGGTPSMLPLWKTTPGDPFVDGDVVTMQFGRIAVIKWTAGGQEIEFQFPTITLADAGKRIGHIVYQPQSPFYFSPNNRIIFTPGSGQAISGFPSNQKTAIDGSSPPVDIFQLRWIALDDLTWACDEIEIAEVFQMHAYP